MGSLRVLIAEDEAVSRRILQRAVDQCGHACQVAVDGRAAWDLFQQSEVDVIISDWMMPGLNGLELCQRVRAHPTAPYTYFILLTALGDKAHFLEGMHAGADDYLAKPFDQEELQARLLAGGRVIGLHRQLAQQNAQLAELNRALGESARTDPLTGLGNRLRLWEDLQSVHGQAERYGHRYAMALCDVDHFKAYNDRYGHPAGDEVLRAVGQTLAAQCRTADRAYRYGGEEFLVLLPGQARDGAAIALNRMRELLAALAIPHAGNSPPGVVTMSAGIAVMEPGAGQTAEALLANADAALYQAKNDGRNRVVVHQPAVKVG
ncbi:MAG TPA: diguanylate cyclase [Chloroflexota bacterium]|jgi:diguanylate cyclase (GGDEF)-like protein